MPRGPIKNCWTLEDHIEKRSPSPETMSFFISGHRLLPLKTEETPCKKRENRKHVDQTTHACNDWSPRPPSPPSQTVPTIGRLWRRGRHHHHLDPCNGQDFESLSPCQTPMHSEALSSSQEGRGGLKDYHAWSPIKYPTKQPSLGDGRRKKTGEKV